MKRTRVRPAVAEDGAAVVRLVRALAAFENAPPETVELDAAAFRAQGFPPPGGPPAAFECLIAELDGRAVGFALYFANFSTWTGRPGLYVEDLFVEEAARGHGLGRALMAAIAARARDRGGRRVDLWVLHWNPARDFYHGLGFGHMSDWLPYRLTGPALKALADGGGSEGP